MYRVFALIWIKFDAGIKAEIETHLVKLHFNIGFWSQDPKFRVFLKSTETEI